MNVIFLFFWATLRVRDFLLIEIENHKDQNKEFVVVMCCGDKKQAEFTNYVQSFPWYHLSFQCELFASLLSKYNVSGYPSCIIFDADGILCQINGVDVIMANNAIERYPWYVPSFWSWFL